MNLLIIREYSSRHSVITEYSLYYNHSFNWKNIKILDSESNYNKKLISETLHIKEQINYINLKKDRESLDDLYMSVECLC